MKKSMLTITILLITINCFSQAPNWVWARSAGGTSYDGAYCAATDAIGNVYVAGYFSNTITFGSTILTSAGTYNLYLVKYDANGNAIWAKNAGGTGLDFANSVVVDANGNVYVAGMFYSNTITFGTTTLTNAGGYDMYLVKYDSAGTILWAKSAGGINYEQSYSVATDVLGNVYVAGYFQSPSITFGTTTLTNADNSGYTYDLFLVKYDSSGNVLWANSAGGVKDERTNCVATDVSGNIYISGSFKSASIAFGTFTLANADITGTTTDAFVTKYDSAGNVTWANRTGGVYNDGANSVTTDASGNVYAAGGFYSSTITFNSTILTNAGSSYDMFLVKYDAGGNVLWANRAGGINDDATYSITSDATGNIYVTGNFQSASINFGTITLTNANNLGTTTDIYLTKYDAGGNVVWATSAGGTIGDYGSAITTDAIGNVYLAGTFQSTTLTFGATILNNAGIYDMYVAKFDGTAGVEETQLERGVIISPNPFTYQTTISFSEEQKHTTITITDVLGNRVNSEQLIVNSKSVTIDMSDVAKGIYFVRIEDANKNVVNRKIIVQ